MPTQLYKELAEKELIKALNHEDMWLTAVPSKQKWMGFDVIKIPKRGDAPSVLIDNGAYPVATSNRADDTVTVSLKKYETTNTAITDDEADKIPYDKTNDVQMQHREELEEKTAEHALYGLGVPAHSVATPVFETTGADDGTGRKRLTIADMTNVWKAKVKDGNRRNLVWVLTPEHAADLIVEDSNRAKSWGADFSKGIVPVNFAGFEMWCPGYEPVRYADDAGTLTKQAWEAETGLPASVIFNKKSVAKAKGTAKRYLRKAGDDPENRETVVGYRIYFVAIGFRNEGSAAVISGTV